MTKGFTLVELMIVIAIIGILAIIAIPAYQDYIARSQVSEAISLAGKFKGMISEIYSQSGVCPTLNDMGLSSATDISSNYIASAAPTIQSGALCAITFTFKNSGVSSGLQNKNLTFSMVSQSTNIGAINWTCNSPDIEQNYLPKACEGI